MKRFLLLLAAALFLRADALPITTTATPPLLCRVTASYTPVPWPAWAEPEDRFRRITVRLRPGCPPDGVARVHLVNRDSGRRLPEYGEYTLSAARPRLSIPGNPPYAVTTPGWEVYWRAVSGRPYRVPQTQTLTPRGDNP